MDDSQNGYNSVEKTDEIKKNVLTPPLYLDWQNVFQFTFSNPINHEKIDILNGN